MAWRIPSFGFHEIGIAWAVAQFKRLEQKSGKKLTGIYKMNWVK
jgi:hypothetical protein